MVKSKIKKVKEQKGKIEKIGHDHFTLYVYELKEGWEEEMLKVWTQARGIRFFQGATRIA